MSDDYRNSKLPAEAGADFTAGAGSDGSLLLDGISRRRFLSLLSASAAFALGSTSCSRIDRGTVVPYTKKPPEIIPGVASYYATTFQEGLTTHGVLVKTREGRPIHIEGNGEDPISRGKTSLRAIGDLLGLYDPDRLQGPSLAGNPSTWEEADLEISAALREARGGAKPMLLLTEAVVSPTRRALIEDLKKALPTLRHAAFEPAMPHAELTAARILYGESVLPRPRLDCASVILSLQADFLGDGGAPELIQDFADRRRISKPTEQMNRLWVLEGCMSLTGANADHRIQVPPSKAAPMAFALARILNESYGVPLPPGMSADGLRSFGIEALARAAGAEPALLKVLATDLARAGKSAAVLVGSALPPEAHVAGNLLNIMLDADGHTLEMSPAPAAQELLNFGGLHDILEEAAHGTYDVAIFWGANPAYAFPDASVWKRAVSKIPTKIRIGLYEDETALDCRWRLPEHHWLESWGDFEAAEDLLRLRQPAIGAIHNTRQGEDIILSWLCSLATDVPRTYLEYLKARWQREVREALSPVPFETFWNAALHDGVLRREASPLPRRVPRTPAIDDALQTASGKMAARPADAIELVLGPAAAIYDGRYANNGWLNELPDPVTKATWGNPLLISAFDADARGLKNGDVAELAAGHAKLEAPVIIQPGQARGVASIALGYGRRTGNVAAGVGSNAYTLIDADSHSPYLRHAVRIARTGRRFAVPRTQEHDRIAGSDLVRSWTLGEYSRKVAEGASAKETHVPATLIPAAEFSVHKWGMVIDLSACVGCSACVIACQSENNVPVVGPERVLAGRGMHWIRVDRYYAGNPARPAVLHQPVTCQHCDDAPCEIVCPVNATTHSPDGLNQMAYNRCVGTRYCSNNCPFKVRRFNFFDYTSMKKPPESLVFNPEVTVRPRGVMEKCTFCVQRIQDVKQKAKVENRPVADGEVMPACAVACPAQAIAFGNLKDPGSKVSRLSKTDRGYRILAELGVKPSVTYLADISNPATGRAEL